MERSYTKEIQFRDGAGKLHGFTTGMVAVKKKFKTASGGSLTSKIRFMLDTEFTEFFPIWVWVIEHPEGIFVVDTGENSRVNSKDYFKQEGPVLNWINTTQFKFIVSPEEEIDRQLGKLNLSPEKITNVLMTHLHLDHIDGLKHFDSEKVLVHNVEWDHPSFALPTLYPKDFSPKRSGFTTLNKTGLNFGLPVTKAKDLFMVATPGHTKGHASVLVETKELSYLLAGDVTYDEQQLYQEIPAGAHQNFTMARQTFKHIKQYATQQQTVYLPSHDPLAIDRIASGNYLRI
jgi:N-acyl homoserine lactone hydrolase